jgi:hypothetical protein
MTALMISTEYFALIINALDIFLGCIPVLRVRRALPAELAKMVFQFVKVGCAPNAWMGWGETRLWHKLGFASLKSLLRKLFSEVKPEKSAAQLASFTPSHRSGTLPRVVGDPLKVGSLVQDLSRKK